MTIAGLLRYDDWRHVATGCNALVMSKQREVCNDCVHIDVNTVRCARFVIKLRASNVQFVVASFSAVA